MITLKNLQRRIPLNPASRRRIREAIRICFSSEKVKKPAEITVCLVSDKKITQMNLKYSGRACPTDVIAFDISRRKDFILADIVVSADTAVYNARAYKTSPLYELYLYVIHGVLHILGYRDKTVRQRQMMDRKAAEILAAVPN